LLEGVAVEDGSLVVGLRTRGVRLVVKPSGPLACVVGCWNGEGFRLGFELPGRRRRSEPERRRRSRGKASRRGGLGGGIATKQAGWRFDEEIRPKEQNQPSPVSAH